MRVLLVTQPLDGGVYRHVNDLGEGLARRGHDVSVAAPWLAPPVDSGFTPVCLQLQRSVSPHDARAAAALARLVRRLRPDVIHAHSSKAGALARLARFSSPGTPVVYTPHGYSFAGHFPPIARAGYRLLERGLSPLTTHVVCVCAAERDLASAALNARRSTLVYNGVDIPDERDDEGDDGRPLMTALTMLRPGKGLDTLLDALPTVLGAVPDARLRLVGDGPERAALEQRARVRGVSEAVDFAGATSDVAAALHGTSVFVHPSWAESFPYAVLDAMARGLPVVATDVGGVREAVLDGVTGRLVPARDPGRLADALVDMLSDRAAASVLGRAAREHARSYTVDDMVASLESVYSGTIAGLRR